MATGSYTTATTGVLTPKEFTQSNLNSLSLNFIGTRMSGVKSDVRNAIPKFAKITSATCFINMKKSSSLWAVNGYWVLRNESLAVTSTLKTYSSGVKTSYNDFSYDCLKYINSENENAGIATSIYCLSFRTACVNSSAKTNFTYKNYQYKCEYILPTVEINATTNIAGGTATATNYTLGTKIDVSVSTSQTVTLKATPKAGYKFVKWADGNTNATRNIIVNQDLLHAHNTILNYQAIFEPNVYITYDSVFNYLKWKNNGIKASNGTISNITNTGFTLTSNDGVAEGTSQSPVFPVTAGETYKIDIDIIGSKWDVYIFFYDSNTTSGLGIDFSDGVTRRFSDGFNQNASFTAPAGATQAAIRVDANGAGNTVTFNNFRIYPSKYSYMSNSVLAESRYNLGLWDIPQPTREGHSFLGWYSQPEGQGKKYSPTDNFPEEDLVLYSHWIINNYTVTFKNQDETTIFTKTEPYGTILNSLPQSPSKDGYVFAGWIPCAPAKKIDGAILESKKYDGTSSSYEVLDKKYKYTNNLSIHLDVYMDDWSEINGRQIISCTESGGWGFGYQANTSVNGAESHGFEVHTGSGYTGYNLKFGTNGEYSNKTWHSFDIIFSNGIIEIFVDGISKGKSTAANTTIKYHSDNAIFVGAEAGTNDSTPTGAYFKGIISNVFISNTGERLAPVFENTIITKDATYYPMWRLDNSKFISMLIDKKYPQKIYVDKQLVKMVYIDKTKTFEYR